MPYKKNVTLRDLAAKLGLTVHTVSKALRGMPGMSEETRHAVIETARKMGYRTKDQERSLAMEHIPLFSSKQHRFKLIFPIRLGSALNHLILSGIQEKLSEYGHVVETIIIPDTIVNRELFDNWTEENNLMYADGIFITPLIETHQESMILSLPIPRIVINFPPPAAQADSVVWDVGTAVHLSVQYLLSMGHRNIMYIGNIQDYRGFRLRWQAFVEAMEEAGIQVDPENHVTDKVQNKRDWIDSTARKLELYKPTAILCALGYDPAWIYHTCSLLGKRIPEDYSLISFAHNENEFLTELTRPIFLIREAGIRAAEKMLWRLANPHLQYEHIFLQGGLFEGGTVKRI
ncbi:LacI family DNA-binding transcriptional regulator [Paenibacillus sp. MBLB4367]|uniref:LacI family DNA-binding transcriptional regulator n=1 Tax=Paenibacillus sp. MBLB4367 TaxID=3384767 RepID=UPI00390829E3